MPWMGGLSPCSAGGESVVVIGLGGDVGGSRDVGGNPEMAVPIATLRKVIFCQRAWGLDEGSLTTAVSRRASSSEPCPGVGASSGCVHLARGKLTALGDLPPTGKPK